MFYSPPNSFHLHSMVVLDLCYSLPSNRFSLHFNIIGIHVDFDHKQLQSSI